MCYDYNQLRPSEEEKKQEILRKLFKKTGKNFHIESPFFCNYGFNITIGEEFYANHNLVILDVCEVTFGNYIFSVLSIKALTDILKIMPKNL